jgi:hypothetical protein
VDYEYSGIAVERTGRSHRLEVHSNFNKAYHSSRRAQHSISDLWTVMFALHKF